jgi:hypothetical protein
MVAATVACGVGVGAACYLWQAKVELAQTKAMPSRSLTAAHSFSRSARLVEQLEEQLRNGHARQAPPERWGVEALLGQLGELDSEKYWFNRFRLNAFTGEPLREEATPGNLLFRLWHDVDCVEHVLATLPTRAP